MIIKKYQAKTESEAVEMAKKELGEGVVILNVKAAKKKGFFHFLFPPKVEITAALEDDGKEVAPTVTSQSPAAQTSQASSQQVSGQGQAQKPGPSVPSQLPVLEAPKKPDIPTGSNINISSSPGGLLPEELIAKTIPESLKIREEMPVAERISRAASQSAIEERLDNLQSLIEKQMNPAFVQQRPASVMGSHSLSDGRIMDSSAEGAKKEPSETDAFIRLLHDTMIDNEVTAENADIIIDEIRSSIKPNMPMDHLLANVYQKMILKFGKSVGIRPSESGVKVIFFIGPTGVGKTTTIAKIASRFRVEEKKKVALLTADTYRIAAAEQLATYAGILDVPIRIVYTPQEMSGAVSAFLDYDYILVDTAGHSHYNESQKENMNQFIHSVDGIAQSEVFLVLSATTKYRDLLFIADAYRNITQYRLIFTKLDETTTLGSLLNLKLYTGTEISYVTAGQNVPDDIENFNPQKTVKQLLGGRR